jgi:hypothetical protein
MNMMIIDTFIKLRELMSIHKELANQMEKVQNKIIKHDNQLALILEYLNQLEKTKREKYEQKNRPRIGYK